MEAAVGDFVGLSVGFIEGASEGCRLGILETVGREEIVGFSVGAGEGLGEMVGLEVGDAVGLSVG